MSEDVMDAFQRHEAAKQETDPRGDLESDSELWRAVLIEARRLDSDPDGPNSLNGLLHGLRSGGSRLKWKDGRLWLDYQALLDTWDEAELRRDWLMPQAANIKAVFAAVEARASQRKSGTARD